MIQNNQTEEQRKEFSTALKTGALRQLAVFRGGTGDLRKELSSKEKARRRTKRKMVKASRRGNR